MSAHRWYIIGDYFPAKHSGPDGDNMNPPNAFPKLIGLLAGDLAGFTIKAYFMID